MTLVKRRIYLSLLVLLFIAGTPLLIFYSRGWRYDGDQGLILQTGSLTVESDPQGADIHIDGEYVGKTPVKALRYPPGEYSLTLKKEGWIIREQNITIVKGQATILDNISLIVDDNQPIRLLTGSPLKLISSRDKNSHAIVVTNDIQESLYIQNKPTDYPLLITSFADENIQKMSWSPNNSSLFIETSSHDGNTTHFYLVSNNILVPILSPNDQPIESLFWDYNNDERIFYYIGGKLLHTPDNISINIPEQMLDMLIAGNKIYILRAEDSGLSLSVRDIKTDEELSYVSLADYQFSDSVLLDFHNNYMTILDTETQIFLLLSTFGNIHIVERDDQFVEYFSWSLEDNQLLLTNSHEIFIAETMKEKELIARYTSVIESPIWQPKKQNIIFILDGHVHVAEPKTSPTVVTQLEDIEGVSISTDSSGEYLFVIDTEGIMRYRLLD